MYLSKIKQKILFFMFLFEIKSLSTIISQQKFTENYFFSQKSLDFYFDSFKDISGRQIKELRNVEHSEYSTSMTFDTSEIKAIDNNFFRLKKYWKKHKNDEFIKCRSLLGDFWVKKNKKLRKSQTKKSLNRRNINKHKLTKKYGNFINRFSNCNTKKSKFVDFIDQNSKKFKKKYGFDLNVCFKFESDLLSCN